MPIDKNTTEPVPSKTNPRNPKTEKLLGRWHYMIWLLGALALLLSLLLVKRLQLISSLKNTIQSNQSNKLNPKKVREIEIPAYPSTLSLELKSESINQNKSLTIGQTYQAQVVIDSAGARVSGADAYIEYNPKKIQIQSITKGQIFSLYPNLDWLTEKDKVTISGTIEPGNAFTGTGTFAIINFKPLATGTSQLSFVFIPRDTRESNIIEMESAKDILSKVSDLTLSVN